VLAITVPLKIRFRLMGGEGKIVIDGNRAYIEATGQAVYVEEFHPT